jgi:hypothetical protein
MAWHPHREAEREDHADEERGGRDRSTPAGMLTEFYNWPHVRDLERGGHAGDRIAPGVAGQPGESGDR